MGKFNESVASRLVRFLAISHTLWQTHTEITAHIFVELACLARIQGLAMKSAWESGGGPEQDTERQIEREGDC